MLLSLVWLLIAVGGVGVGVVIAFMSLLGYERSEEPTLKFTFYFGLAIAVLTPLLIYT